MEKIMIKGKPYVQVNQRVLELRQNYGDKYEIELKTRAL